jgi:hypothetical protein
LNVLLASAQLALDVMAIGTTLAMVLSFMVDSPFHGRPISDQFG